MEKLFYKYPETIGEELEIQIKYAKHIGTIKNNEDLSICMRELEEEVFGKARRYTCKENNTDEKDKVRNSRVATITELKKIANNQKITNYFLLFSAFKALNIIKEDYNIIKLFDFYGIKPKKAIDKEHLKELENDFGDLGLYSFAFHTRCSKENNEKCNFEGKCIFLKMKSIFHNISIDEQIKMLYDLGFPSNLMQINPKIYGMYYISLETLKNILQKFEENELIEYIREKENELNEVMQDWENRKKESYRYVLEIEQECKKELEGCKKDKESDRKGIEELIKAKNTYVQVKKLKKNIEKRNDYENKIEHTREYKQMIAKIKKYSNGLYGR